MKKNRLMIVMGEHIWTLTTLHLACALSRRRGAEIILVKMVPVRHPLLLGTPAGSMSFTSEDAAVLEDLTATAEDYGVALDIQLCQYANYWAAVVDAAAQLNAAAVITHIPHLPLPYWHYFRRWWLRHQLARHQQKLLLIEELTPTLTWTPSLTWQEEFPLESERPSATRSL